LPIILQLLLVIFGRHFVLIYVSHPDAYEKKLGGKIMKNFESAKLELTYTNAVTNKETRITLNGLVADADTVLLNNLAVAVSNLVEDPFTDAVAVERYAITA
jgi:nucleoside diphosphate kinase